MFKWLTRIAEKQDALTAEDEIFDLFYNEFKDETVFKYDVTMDVDGGTYYSVRTYSFKHKIKDIVLDREEIVCVSGPNSFSYELQINGIVLDDSYLTSDRRKALTNLIEGLYSKRTKIDKSKAWPVRPRPLKKSKGKKNDATD